MNYLLKPLTLKNCRLKRISLNSIWVALSFKNFVFIAIDMKEHTSCGVTLYGTSRVTKFCLIKDIRAIYTRKNKTYLT